MMEVEENEEEEGKEEVLSLPSADEDSSSSDSSSDDSDIQDIMKLEDRIKQLNDLMGTDPSKVYDCYLEKISIYKELGDLGQVRTVREKMSKLYPLSAEIWLDWIHDEIGLAQTSEEKQHVFDLFDRATKDYLSVDVWMAYINYVMKGLDDPETISATIPKLRDVYEKALVGCALHVSKGSLIWNSYREFEAAQLSVSNKKEQKDKFELVCRRQLSTALIGMEEAYESIKKSYKLSDVDEQNYKIALEKLHAIMPFETRLAEAVEYGDKLEAYITYIAEEKRQRSNPPRLICLYARALCDFPLECGLWLEYLEYVSQELRLDQLIFKVAEQAVRNCPGYMTLWTKYLQQLEKYRQDADKIKEVFERGLSYCQTGENAGVLWLKYLEYFQRRVNATPDLPTYDLFMLTLKAAEEHLTSLLFDPNEYIAEVLLLDLRARVHRHKSLEKGRDVWMNLLGRGYGHVFKVWLEFYHLELRYGDVKSTRRCIEKGLNSVDDHFDIISSIWLNFERSFGDLITMTRCEKAIATRMERIQKRMAIDTELPSKKQKPRKRKKPDQGDSGTGEQAVDDDKCVAEKKSRSNENDTHGNSSHPSTSKDNKKQFQPRARQNREFKQPNRPFNRPRFPPKPREPEPTLVRRPPKSFVPRSLQVRREDTIHATASEDVSKSSTKMSNEDFRNLFKKSSATVTSSEKE